MSRYSKNLSGLNQKVVVGTATYTDDTTFAAFIANAGEGEVGIFLDSGAVRTTALTAGLKFFVAQKRDGGVSKSPIINYDDIFRKLKTAYAAPVKQISTIGYNGTTGDLSWTGFVGATINTPLTYGISVRETTPGNQPFPVQEGYVVVTSTSKDEYDALATIVTQLNMNFDYQRTMPDRFVKAEILSDGTPTYLISTIDPTVTLGSRTVTYSAAVTVATGAFLFIRGAIYKVTTGVTAGTSLTIDRPYEGATETIDVSVETTAFANTVTYTSGTTKLGVRLTALEYESHFKVAGSELLYADTVTAITAWVLGAGSGTKIYELESTEGAIFDGVGSTINAAFKADYGQPTVFADTALTYDQFFIDAAPKILPSAALPIYEQKQIERVLIAAPVGGTLASTLVTVFGV